MAGGHIHLILIQGQKPLKAGQIGAPGRQPLLLEVVGQDIQHHVLAGDDQLRRAQMLRRQQGGAGIYGLYRLGGMLMAGAGDVGIHIVLGEADLTADFIGIDLAPADQVIDGGLADMENIRNFLGR